jgi:hypothetical protein
VFSWREKFFDTIRSKEISIEAVVTLIIALPTRYFIYADFNRTAGQHASLIDNLRSKPYEDRQGHRA